MSGGPSLTLIATAATPAIALIALGGAWILWKRSIHVIPAVVLSLGLALFALLLLIVVAKSFGDASALGDSILLIGALPLLVYAGALALLLRSASIVTLWAVTFGLAGLIPLYFVGVFVLINSACAFGGGGC